MDRTLPNLKDCGKHIGHLVDAGFLTWDLPAMVVAQAGVNFAALTHDSVHAQHRRNSSTVRSERKNESQVYP
jgi:hypothetical protein